MSFLSQLRKLEVEVVAYAEEAGKDVETVFEEIKAFVIEKRTENANAKAAASTPGLTGPLPKTAV